MSKRAKSRIQIEHERIQKKKKMEAQNSAAVERKRIVIDDDEDDEIIPRVSKMEKLNHPETDEFQRKLRDKAIKNGENKTKYDGYDKAKIALSAIFKLGVVAIIAFMVVMYGPWGGFREWLITTAMTTMHHQYFATWFFDPDVIAETLEKNKVELRDDTTDTSLVDTTANTQVTEYASEYERLVLERDPKNNDYKIFPLKDKNFTGYMVAVYEPKRLKVAVTSRLGVSGEYVTKMAEDHDALIAINGGGFVDNANYNGNGETPMGLSIGSFTIVLFTTRTLDVPPSKFAALYAPYLFNTFIKSSISAPGFEAVLPSTIKNRTIPSVLWAIAVLGAVPQPPFPTTDEAFPLTIKNGPKVTASLMSFSFASFTLTFEVRINLLALVKPIIPPAPEYCACDAYAQLQIVTPSGEPPVLLKLGSSNPPPFIAINASLSSAIVVKY